ncbi:BRCA2-interacting transcriptional repressor EMSY [Neoarius graeffei]|uniref:BRCA2-interacting transcriptional repressor EMSY n=1 Tax=Neoarius graeffei TaxID=443677 RepID=UPI00298D144F|nr:BRCA2-interacting transcriptional repressor EMSY [Neoarius graeffei]XP_060764929.1 BRCA2-interacting transcriptional repressor EMSY [Neoarius graeffei]XP_060764930.1 BRCA2-interacting transcriptional repressor EMSY [Neoarius graeffei]
MIQQEKPQLPAAMPVVWPTLLDLSRDDCKRILRKLELEAYAGVISALRAQGDLTKDKKDLLGELTKVLSISTERHRAEVRRAVNDERLTTIAYHMSGPNSSSEWSIEGRRLVPLMPRLVPQTAFTVTANAVASATAHQNSSLLLPAETGNKEVVVCYSYTSTTATPPSVSTPSGSAAAAVKSPRPTSPASNVVVLPSGSTVYVKSVSCSDEDEKPRKRRRTNSSGSSPVLLKEVPKVTPTTSKSITVPVSSSPKMSNLMQSIANSLPPHMSPVKITFTKPSTQATNTTTQKVIIVTTSASSSFVPNILSKSHNYAAVSKLVSSSAVTSAGQKQTMVISAGTTTASGPVAVTTVVSSTPAVVMSTVAQTGSTAAVKVATARMPSPKALVGSPSPILQFPKQQQQQQSQQSVSPKGLSATPLSSSPQTTNTLSVSKPTIQIKQESGVKIITQQMQPSKILPKPSSAAMPSSSSGPIMVVSSNGAIMTTKLVSTPTGTQATYTRPSVTPSIGARMATSPAGTTYVKTTSGSIITVVPKSLATLGGKIISTNMVSGTTTKITTIPMTSKPNVIVVQKTTGKGTTIQGLPGKNVVTTLLNAGGEKALQAVPGAKPAIITASRPITKMIVTQPKSLGSAVQPSTTTKLIPTKIVYGQQGKTQVLIKPKPMAFQATVVSEQTRQLVSETLQQVSRGPEASVIPGSSQEGALKDDSSSYMESSPTSSDNTHDTQSVVHVISSRGQEWTEQEVSVEASPTIIYQDMSGEAQSATSTIKALLELQQTTAKEKAEAKPRQHTIDLSQMAVPIQMPTEKRESPEPSGQAAGEPETPSEATGKVGKVVAGGEVSTSCSQSSALSSTMKSSNTASSTSTSSVTVQAGSGKPLEEQAVVEEGELEGDTLDPQTGLFYRSVNPSAPPPPPPPPPLQQHRTPTHTLNKPLVLSISTPTKSTLSQTEASKMSSIARPPVSAVTTRADKPSVSPAPSLSAPSGSAAQHAAATKPVHTPQLPRLQQAPSSHNRPNMHTQLSQPPPLQAHHPVASDKAASSSSSQVQQPIITQGAAVTKITFGAPPVSSSSSSEAAVKLQAESSSEKPNVSDILKISMMEAEIEPGTEAVVVDSSSDCSTFSKAASTSQLISSSKHTHTHTHATFGRIQKSKDLDVIQVIPQYSIMPDSSQSNVVVEPSGFLEITDYTSQRLDDEATLDQEVDSSNDEGAAPSPMETCADQSQ